MGQNGLGREDREMLTGLGIIFTLGVVIFFHELGHFLAAKAFGVRVEKFSLGFGPEAAGFTRGKTRYMISYFPLGGYVKFYDDDPAKPASGEKDSYLSQKWWKRVVIVLAGPVWNVFLAFLVFSSIFYLHGILEPKNLPVIGETVPGRPAHESGLMKGDVIKEIDGIKMLTWEQMADYIHGCPEKMIRLVIDRKGDSLTVDITPVLEPAGKIGLIGILPDYTKVKLGFFDSFWKGLRYCLGLCLLFFKSIFLMIVGKMRADITGPIGIAKMITEVSRTGLANFFHLLAVISVNLGLINLIPIPILDGGHIGFLFIEGVLGRPVSPRRIEIAQTFGVALLVVLMLLATWQDILRLVR